VKLPRFARDTLANRARQEPKPEPQEKCFLELKLEREGYVKLPDSRVESAAYMAFVLQELRNSDREKIVDWLWSSARAPPL